jgi:hypothetical protein
MQAANKHKGAGNDNIISRILPDSWEQQADASYSSNDLIDAYFKGKRDEKTQNEKILFEKLRQNIAEATKIAETFINTVKDKGIKILYAHLKIEDIGRFNFLFVVEEEHYFSDAFRDIIVLSQQIKKDRQTDTFQISFTFTHNSDKISEECIVSDGYILRYDGKA